MIQCTKCNLQYIGETKRRLKDRFNEHRRPIINPFCSYTPQLEKCVTVRKMCHS